MMCETIPTPQNRFREYVFIHQKMQAEGKAGLESPLLELPPELTVFILSFLDIASLLRVSGLCSYLYTLSSLPEIWRAIVPYELGEQTLSSLFADLEATPLLSEEELNDDLSLLEDLEKSRALECNDQPAQRDVHTDTLRIFGLVRDSQQRTKLFRPGLLARKQPTLLPLRNSDSHKRGVAHYRPFAKLLFCTHRAVGDPQDTTEPGGISTFPPPPKKNCSSGCGIKICCMAKFIFALQDGSPRKQLRLGPA